MSAAPTYRRWLGSHRQTRRTHGARRGTQARRAANSNAVSLLGRAGLAARGVMYVLIGIIAVQIAVGSSGRQADNAGAVRLVAGTPVGSAVLWLLAIGLAGMALWRLSEAIWGRAGRNGRTASTRLLALAKAVLYGALAFSVFKYALGLGAPASSDKQTQDLTAKAMHAPGGQALVTVVGIAVAGIGVYMAYQAWTLKFQRDLRMNSASATTRRIVRWLGRIGGIARGAIFVTAGIFLIVAATDANPSQAKGIDSALRALAHTPLGPPLLVLVAVGLVLFGAYSLCAARWADV